MSSRLWALFIHFIKEILTTYHSLLRWANLNKEIRKMLTGIIYFFVDFILTFLMSFIFDILVCAAYEKAIARKNLLNNFFLFSHFVPFLYCSLLDEQNVGQNWPEQNIEGKSNLTSLSSSLLLLLLWEGVRTSNFRTTTGHFFKNVEIVFLVHHYYNNQSVKSVF